MPPSQAPNLTRTGTFDPKKNYINWRLQQGVPVLDVDVNDGQDMISWAVNQALTGLDAKMPIPHNIWELALRPVTRAGAGQDGAHARNSDNIAIQLGRIQSKLGLIDTKAKRNPALFDFAIFDWKLILDNAAALGQDNPYENFLFAGKVTSGGVGLTLQLVDENKNFTVDFNLIGVSETHVIPGAAQTSLPWNPAYTGAVDPCEIQIYEPAARVVFLSGANAGVERPITSLANSTTIGFAALPSPLALGDEYIIVPGNAFTTYRSAYDAANIANSFAFGLANVGLVMCWLHIFTEDVSSEEDPDINDPNLPVECSHRTALRWCLRTAVVKISTPSDAGRDTLHSVHFENLFIDKTNGSAELYGGDFLAKSRSFGDDGTIHDGDDLVQALPSSETSQRKLRGWDVNWNAASHGITRHHSYFNSAFEDNSALLHAVKACLDRRFTFDPAHHENVVLLVFGSPQKELGTEVLSEYVYPNLTTNQATTIPRICTDLELYSNRSFIFAPRHRHADLAAISTDLERSRSLAWSSPGLSETFLTFTRQADGPPPQALVERQSFYEAPLMFRSVADHFAWLDMVALSVTGLGNMQGTRTPAYTTDGRVPPSNMHFLPQNAANTILQAGHSNVTFLAPANVLLNANQKLQGAVHPIDVLSGAGTPLEVVNFLGDFVPGPGEYKLRDGTTITPFSDTGWSFYKKTHEDYESPGDAGVNFQRRPWEEGLSQAYHTQQSLMFRKLAIKTSAHIQGDLFTVDIKAPTIVTVPAEFVFSSQPVPANYPNGGKIKDPGLATGYGAAALGAFREASEFDFNNVENVPRQIAHSTYSGLGPNTLEDNNSMRGIGNSTDLANTDAYGYGGSNAVERWDYNMGLAGTPEIAGNVKIDKNFGAWGRFSITPDGNNGGLLNTPEMLDQWQNRCTAIRLRYHIGDYYPGPVDDRGIPVNALVDTLNLFLRVEPLPLVHWMTLPKHQHPVLEGSLSFIDMMQRLWSANWLQGTANTDAFWDTANSQPLIVSTNFGASPAHLDARFAPDNQAGDVDPLNQALPYKVQPFVHWYHPFQEYLLAPHPFNSSSTFTGGASTIAYRKFGESSLIVPALTTLNQNIAIHDTTEGITTENFGQDPAAFEIGLGHWNDVENPSTANRNVSIGSGGGTIFSNEMNFPFIPPAATNPALGGRPGPVFLPASRTYALDAAGNFRVYGVHKLLRLSQDTWGTALQQMEFDTWPQIDADGYAADSVAFPTFAKWSVPVLRAAIKTDTIKAIFDLFALRTTADWPTALLGTIDQLADESVDDIPATGPDFTADTVFVGDSGTALMIDAAGRQERTFFLNALALGIPARITTGHPSVVGDARTQPDVVVNDIFELCMFEREQGLLGVDAVNFLPLINTFSALRHQGLQQKLLFNSSLRVLHARPGGGMRPGLSTPVNASSITRSLTEIFITRDRQTGVAVTMPSAPNGAANKPYLHLESMHPTAAGSGPYNQHPNHAKLGHLYPMICDTTGGPSTGAGGSSDPLSSELASPDHRYAAAEYLLQEFKTGAAGDCFVADPFDYEISKRTADNLVLTNKVAKRDRLHMNSGIEIDLVSELRYLRANAATHGLDLVGLNGLTWLDMLPSVGELTAPGDHEIIFVLYTGSYGQKFVSSSVPDGYNPSVAGCHVVASIEINRPNEKVSSVAGGFGEHYGEQREVYNILGHQ